MDIPNEREFVARHMNLKKLHHDFNYHYQVEYEKGLELKSGRNYIEALGIFDALNKIKPFSWNYYQIGIIRNGMGEVDDTMEYLKKAIDMDLAIKEDARTYYELDNLRSDPQFYRLLT